MNARRRNQGCWSINAVPCVRILTHIDLSSYCPLRVYPGSALGYATSKIASDTFFLNLPQEKCHNVCWRTLNGNLTFLQSRMSTRINSCHSLTSTSFFLVQRANRRTLEFIFADVYLIFRSPLDSEIKTIYFLDSTFETCWHTVLITRKLDMSIIRNY